VHITAGAYHLAEPLFEECFELRKATLGPTHLNTLKSMYSVAAMMFNQVQHDVCGDIVVSSAAVVV
jgi:hypothetical protein